MTDASLDVFLERISPITSETIEAAGYEPTAGAKTYTVEDLADAIKARPGAEKEVPHPPLENGKAT